ncbi:MAG TPA: menaquinone biosynthesis protein [Miltoncostaeales bacterium]|nr:menaquinone biosynthesis protein [Miltoncostaeales bacterium]
MSSSTSPLRVGRIVALNMYPVYHPLEAANLSNVAFTDGLPTTLNRLVIAGDLDMSAMSSIEYARHSDMLELLPVGSITAAGAVDSIQVFSRVPFEQIRSVAVTTHSASSVALLRVLVGPDVVFTPLTGTVWEELTNVDGVLLIADEALAEMRRPSATYATDLGERWRALTGLPMVFAVWAVRREVADARRPELEQLGAIIREASLRHQRDPEGVVAAATERFPFPQDFIRHYFTRLSYDFGASERASLERFFELAHDAGELSHVPALPD